jgi:hypothetical protein
MTIANSNPQGEESHTLLKPNRTRKPSKRRRKKPRARDEYVGYAMRAASWDYYFSFHISDPKSRWDPGPYSRLATLSFKGDLIRPEGAGYNRAEVNLSARTGMMEEHRGELPRSVGSLTATGDGLSAYVG